MTDLTKRLAEVLPHDAPQFEAVYKFCRQYAAEQMVAAKEYEREVAREQRKELSGAIREMLNQSKYPLEACERAYRRTLIDHPSYAMINKSHILSFMKRVIGEVKADVTTILNGVRKEGE